MRYLDDRRQFDHQSRVMAVELFGGFSQWLKDNRHQGWSDQSGLGRTVNHRGEDSVRSADRTVAGLVSIGA
jgi:hypothetical protein